MKSGLEDRNNFSGCADGFPGRGGLNEVRPGRPEQLLIKVPPSRPIGVSMKSGLEDRNNARDSYGVELSEEVSMKSGLEDRNNPIIQCQLHNSGMSQ